MASRFSRAHLRFLRKTQRSAVGSLRRLRNHRRQLSPIFVTGLMGSGTTLTSLMMASSFPVAGMVKEGAREIKKGSALWMRKADTYPSINDYLADLLEKPQWDVSRERSWMQGLYRSRATQPGSRIVDKAPAAHMLRVRFLHRCFPEAPFVIIFRDPVANIEGLRRKWRLFGSSALGECISFYRHLHEECLSLLDECGLEPIVVDFDSLTADEQAALERLSERLGLSRVSQRVAIEDRPNVRGKGVRNVVEGRVSVVPGTSQAAYQWMSPQEIDQIRTAAAPVYQRMLELAQA